MRVSLGVLLVLLISIAVLLTGCNQTKNTSDIEDNLNQITANKQFMVSSNPYDFIKSEISAYEEIVSMGDEALLYLTNELRTNDRSGLKEWIMAKACEDILKEKSPVKEWGSAKEWIEKYDASSKYDHM